MKLTWQVLRLLPLLLALNLGGGCATKALWDNGNLESWNEPASEPRLHLFDAGTQRDLLVVYDEYSERSGVTRTRAYWLNENQKRLSQRRSPHFVSTNAAAGLAVVPVFREPSARADLPPTTYALIETNHQSFTVYYGTREFFSHDLPVYNDGGGKVEKFVLTPAAVSADLTIIGGVLGYMYIGGMCSYNSSY